MSAVFQRLGPYEIASELGRGGMAVVFLATDTRNGQRVALKLVPIGTDREALEILDAERWGARLQEQFCRVSRHVPTVYEHATDWGYFYLAMEYLAGRNLSEVIAGGRLPAAGAVVIASELCRFLEAAHAFEATIDDRKLRSLLHGDLKPRNVRITEGDNQIKVLDFGIAKALSLSRKVTRNDFGSLAYLSPERLDSGDIDAHADFWAVGVLLYEMVSGVQPFRAPDTRRLEQQIISRRPPLPLPDDCPPGLRAIVAKLLGPQREDRYPSATAIREDLERFTAGQETVAEAEGGPRAALDEPATRRTRPAVPDDDEATRRTAGHGIPPPLPPPLPPAGAVSVASPAVAAAPQTLPAKPARRRRPVRIALLLAAIWLVGNEIWVGQTAEQLTSGISSLELDGLPEAWNQYEELADRSHLGLAADDMGRSLTRHTMTLAERVFGNYRMPQPTVREAQWKSTRVALARALTIAPGDEELTAALRYCDGHLHRIDGEAKKGRKESAAALQKFTDSVTAFREAAELRPKWPDPFLGLARTFIYGLEDVDRGADAINQARRLGHAPGDRETIYLADGYRARAQTLVRTARGLVQMPQEQEYLTRAAEAYRQALSLYAAVVGFPGVADSIRAAQRGLAQVEERLTRLSLPMPSEDDALEKLGRIRDLIESIRALGGKGRR